MNRREVVVVTGAGGIGQAIARRQGTGRTILFADLNEQTLAAAATTLKSAGHVVETHPVDVSSRESVHALAEAAAARLLRIVGSTTCDTRGDARDASVA